MHTSFTHYMATCSSFQATGVIATIKLSYFWNESVNKSLALQELF